MTLSIYTPTHNPNWLAEAYKSLVAQTDADWEWVVLHNNGSQPVGFEDSRVRELVLNKPLTWVGPLKDAAAGLCGGDILLELDHDDLLMPTAVAEVKAAFSDPDVGFVYSNTIHCTGNFKPIQRFDTRYGWDYRTHELFGATLDEHLSFAPTPNSISRIWFAPNHLRAVRKTVFDQVGGYSAEMRVLDDLDLMCRLYQVTKFHHIDKPLYLYRVHGNNTWLLNNSEIQNNVYRIHDQYIQPLALAWSKRENLRSVDLGGRFNSVPGFESVDLVDADVITDLNGRWPFEDGSVGVVRAFDIFEHLKDIRHTMSELWRVLAPGGYALIQVPSTDGRGAFQDPTHVSFWNENSFLYYTNRVWGRFIDTPCRFQSMRCFTTAPDEQKVVWSVAHLVKLVPGMRVPGLVEI